MARGAVPLLVALLVFVLVLSSTPPGFGAIPDQLLGLARGPNLDAAAFALGAASSLALVSLVVVAGAFAVIGLLRRPR
jgi:hypothetical protein